MAEAIMNKLIEDRNLQDQIVCDSAGTSANHQGENPDPRTIEICEKYDVQIAHKARQIQPYDFNTFHFLVAMDESNFLYLNKMAQSNMLPNNHIMMMREFDTNLDNINVADPWFGDLSDFESCYQTLSRNCQLLLDQIIKK
ncbi:MAG: low molecular weight phosphotyrosine protein phosphatase [Bacteroidetes bacterium]|nr:low molecular weight phosphotyrosine protein phosphatase [Bacteroidota bacterium]